MNFFNKATNAVEAMGKNVSKAAKDNVEIVKCSSAIDSCEKKIKEVYTEIGDRYYNSDPDVSRDAFADLFEVVDANKKQIEELKERLQNLKGIVICKECGTELSKDAKFCRSCGAKIEQPVKPVQPDTLPASAICWNCHSPLTGNEKFCVACGAKIERPEPDEKQPEPVVQAEAEKEETSVNQTEI